MTTVIVPWRGGCPHREAAWEWLQTRYAEQLPDWEVIEATCPAGPWVKARAVMPALRFCDEGVVIVADADVWCDGLPEAVGAVEDGAPWAIPHGNVYRLSEAGTKAVMQRTATLLPRRAGPAEGPGLALAQAPYRGLAGGGYVIARRETFRAIPLDTRFEGWGQEDHSWGFALHFLAGVPWRGRAPLVHLHHPEPKRLSRKRGSVESWRLFRRYDKARRDPEQMRQLINEAKGVANQTSESTMHDRPAQRVG